MQEPYDETRDNPEEPNDDDLFFDHVIGEDHELMAVDLLLSSALAKTQD